MFLSRVQDKKHHISMNIDSTEILLYNYQEFTDRAFQKWPYFQRLMTGRGRYFTIKCVTCVAGHPVWKSSLHTLIHLVYIVLFHSLTVTFDEKYFFFRILGNAFFGTPGTIWPISCPYMAIWVSKDASGSQKCSPMFLNNISTD